MVDAPLDLAAVGFQLGFARAARADAAAQLRHRFALAAQPRQHVLQLRQLHLQLAFAGAGVAGKDVQNQLRPVQHAAGQRSLQVAQLRRRKVVVEEHQVGLGGGGDAGESPPLCRSQSAWPDRAARAAACISAATTPPALATSSRNSARDSSASSSVDERAAAALAGETLRAGTDRRSRWHIAESAPAGSAHTAACRAPVWAARLPRERTPRSTPTRTARSGSHSRRSRRAMPTPACSPTANRDRFPPAIAAPQSAVGGCRHRGPDQHRWTRQPDDARCASRSGCSPRSKWRA